MPLEGLPEILLGFGPNPVAPGTVFLGEAFGLKATGLKGLALLVGIAFNGKYTHRNGIGSFFTLDVGMIFKALFREPVTRSARAFFGLVSSKD